ncbi:YhgE/Pip family protein [Subtercola sp. RTI3]|uniref:YhgE/Pip family protein n=1 Tax=Subtercola sp. RTI3 TaxID=3048639 RepID=UPI002B23824E|nr:YhgE/Pip family protein [Subtercola sp. RTI3]MEA9986394.1 YhgE/Pip family protein [Subtercola sp. RTI3]
MSSHAASAPVRSHRRRRAWWFTLAALAVVVVPLAANGLFSSAFSNVGDNLNKVPAALVNNDKLITTTAADGTKSTVFAGRGLVTQLTGSGQTGFDWNVTNSADAAKGLADGTYYAVLTIPEDFSAQINTLATPTPQQGAINITTDNSHGYLAGVVASTVGSALKAGFGQTVTAQVVNGVYSSFGTIGAQLSSAATGAGQLASGAGTLTDGLNQLATGAGSAATGASQLSSGVTQYTDGVDSLAGGSRNTRQAFRRWRVGSISSRRASERPSRRTRTSTRPRSRPCSARILSSAVASARRPRVVRRCRRRRRRGWMLCSRASGS